ncbi:hypothetical protein DH2020_031399 [Rehmannia glutinosa]|uniref:Sieve element occlusion N-terminal domain-containing protein n=1 Tax=Rehmannia glutinosa TaxID=99300 RepID=A0ABR0VI61_REHGL
MSAANTLGLEGDSLYLDKQKFINLASTALPLPSDVEPDLRDLLDLVHVIMNQNTLSISESKVEAKPKRTTQRTDSGTRIISGVMQSYVSSIAQQIAHQDGKTDSDKTWKILESHPEIPLKTKAILAVVAFATMYGKVRLVALVQNSNQLARSITLLKQQPDIQGESDLTKWFDALNKVMKLTLDVSDRVMDMKETQLAVNNLENVIRTQMLLSTAVYRIINVVVICWSQVVTILIKHSRKEIISYLWVLDVWEREMNNKRLEIEGKSAKDLVPQLPTPDEQRPQALNLATRQTNGSCWLKLCQLLNLQSVKSQRQTKASYTRAHSLPDRLLVFSNANGGAGALSRDEEAVERETIVIHKSSHDN